jgi:hypothetical protein
MEQEGESTIDVDEDLEFIRRDVPSLYVTSDKKNN